MDCERTQERVPKRYGGETRTYRFIKHNVYKLLFKKYYFFYKYKKIGDSSRNEKKKEEKGQSAISIDKYKIEDKV